MILFSSRFDNKLTDSINERQREFRKLERQNLNMEYPWRWRETFRLTCGYTDISNSSIEIRV